MKKSQISQIKEFLKNHNNFLISVHTSPEGDCLGAQLAFAKVLRNMGKKYYLVNSDNYPKEYSFLPEINKITTTVKVNNFDAAVILDCSDISRIGNVINLLRKDMPILNIDHHISNAYFGDINLVDAKHSSACEALYFLFKQLNIKIDYDIALCLYTGIVTDTGSFRYTNTGALTHLAVSELMKWHIDAPDVFRNIYENLGFKDLKLINTALLNIERNKDGNIAWVKIGLGLFKKYKSDFDITDNILSSIRAINGVELYILFREMPGEKRSIRINLRSIKNIDVNKIAQHFGGGGHKNASAATLRDISLKEAESKVINFSQKQINADF